jgi:distribution and morphology protein 34
MGGARGMLAAKHPLVVPMLLRLSHFKLSSYVVLVVSKQKGITLVFKTDPLQAVDINSTFDSIAVIQNFIQREIEGQLRQMFREDLPGIIHRLSQQWVKAKVEAPYLDKRPPATPLPHQKQNLETMSAPDALPSRHAAPYPGLTHRTSQSSIGTRRPRTPSTSGTSVAGSSRSHSHKFAPHTSSPLSPAFVHTIDNTSIPSSHPDLENFDPTYGLRPEGLPTKSVFRGFSSLFVPNKGLADLAEEELEEESEAGYEDEDEDQEYDVDEGGSFDFVEWDRDPHSRSSPAASVHAHSHSGEVPVEYETIPAVGGGTIVRPRVYHAQSAIGLERMSKSTSALPTRSYSQSMAQIGMAGVGNRSGSATPATASTAYFSDYGGGSGVFSSNLSRPRTRTPDSLESPPSLGSSSGPSRGTHSIDLTEPMYASASSSSAHYDRPRPHSIASASAVATSAIYMRRPPSERRMSVTSTTTNTTFDAHNASLFSDPSFAFGATSPSGSTLAHASSSNLSNANALHPSPDTPTLHQLSTLSQSNHTLSPYTRGLAHFTVRSVPPRGNTGGRGGAMGGKGQAGMLERPKAKRKRTYRLGGKKPASSAPANVPPAAGTMAGGEDADGDPPTDYFAARPGADEARLGASSPTPPSEFDVSDMDRYFPPHDAVKTVKSAARRRTQRQSLDLPPLTQPRPLSPNQTLSQSQSRTRVRPELRPPL